MNGNSRFVPSIRINHQVRGQRFDAKALANQVLGFVGVQLHGSTTRFESKFLHGSGREDRLLHPLARHAPLGVKVNEQWQLALFRFLKRRVEFSSPDAL